jgi:ArsR family transcriptional regulator, lead/cadmium/zinc/bismuth-responsive transcriptional repressor
MVAGAAARTQPRSATGDEVGGRVIALRGADECRVRMVDADKVRAVRAAMPAERDVGALADVLSLLGDPTRLKLLAALLAAGEMCVCDLAAATGQSESAVSHALRLLRAHRVVSARRSHRMAYYRLEDGHVRMLLDVGLAHTGHATIIHDADCGRRPQP